jgi:hypothetical protein
MTYENGVPVGWQALEFYHIARTYAERNAQPTEAYIAIRHAAKCSPAGDPSKPWTRDDIVAIIDRAYALSRYERDCEVLAIELLALEKSEGRRG